MYIVLSHTRVCLYFFLERDRFNHLPIMSFCSSALDLHIQAVWPGSVLLVSHFLFDIHVHVYWKLSNFKFKARFGLKVIIVYIFTRKQLLYTLFYSFLLENIIIILLRILDIHIFMEHNTYTVSMLSHVFPTCQSCVF
jgi:hypothetical protein